MGESLWGHMYGDYEVNPPSITAIPPGDYVIFLTENGRGWSVMTGVTIKHDVFSDRIYYYWSTGQTTKTATFQVDSTSVIKITVTKRGRIGEDNIVIHANE